MKTRQYAILTLLSLILFVALLAYFAARWCVVLYFPCF